MEYSDVKAILDEKVKAHKEASKISYVCGDIYIVIPTCNVICNHIEIIADIMGFSLEEEIFYDGVPYKYMYYFEYKGVKFVDYKEERLESFAHRD